MWLWRVQLKRQMAPLCIPKTSDAAHFTRAQQRLQPSSRDLLGLAQAGRVHALVAVELAQRQQHLPAASPAIARQVSRVALCASYQVTLTTPAICTCHLGKLRDFVFLRRRGARMQEEERRTETP